MTPEMNWSLVQSFLAVAESGSLSAAARTLGMTQPTVGRHIQTLEQSMDVTLFRRQARGMALSAQGEALLDHARAMRDAANALSLEAAEKTTTLAGTVRITSSVFVSHHLMPPVLSELRQLEPQIELELLASDTAENLLFREADIAVRMFQPEQLDMIALHLGSIQMGVFASHDFLKRHKLTGTIDDLMTTPIVGYDRSEVMIRGFRDAGFPVTREFFPVRCDNQAVYWELVRAGCGMGFGPVYAAANDPMLEQVQIDGLDIPSLGVWLTAHEAVRHTPRVDTVWQLLAKRMAPICKPANPGRSPAHA